MTTCFPVSNRLSTELHIVFLEGFQLLFLEVICSSLDNHCCGRVMIAVHPVSCGRYFFHTGTRIAVGPTPLTATCRTMEVPTTSIDGGGFSVGLCWQDWRGGGGRMDRLESWGLLDVGRRGAPAMGRAEGGQPERAAAETGAQSLHGGGVGRGTAVRTSAALVTGGGWAAGHQRRLMHRRFHQQI